MMSMVAKYAASSATVRTCIRTASLSLGISTSSTTFALHQLCFRPYWNSSEPSQALEVLDVAGGDARQGSLTEVQLETRHAHCQSLSRVRVCRVFAACPGDELVGSATEGLDLKPQAWRASVEHEPVSFRLQPLHLCPIAWRVVQVGDMAVLLALCHEPPF